MYAMPGCYPVCGDICGAMHLHCRQSESAIEGHFSMNRMTKLNVEQVPFVKTFLRYEGAIKCAERELGVSHPAVRVQLEDLILAVVFEVAALIP